MTYRSPCRLGDPYQLGNRSTQSEVLTQYGVRAVNQPYYIYQNSRPNQVQRRHGALSIPEVKEYLPTYSSLVLSRQSLLPCLTSRR